LIWLSNPSAEADRLAAELARQIGETKTEVVTKALRDRLARAARAFAAPAARPSGAASSSAGTAADACR
jgi:hypothetical protein